MFLIKSMILILLGLFIAPITMNSQVATDDHSVQFTIPVVTLMDIEPNISPVNLSFEPPTEAGDPITFPEANSNSTKYLNYTSAIATGGTSKKITVQLTSGSVPPGVLLRVQASSALAGGAGSKGLSTGIVNIDQVARNVITGIGRCYTGDGSGRGHLLTYSLAIDDYSLLNFNANNSVQITYTISD